MLKPYLTLKLTFSSRGSSLITKVIPEIDFPDKITRKKVLNLVPNFICEKPIFAYLTL